MAQPATSAVPFMTERTRRLAGLLSWTCLIALLFLANSLLVNQIANRQTPDEVIPIGVIQHMRATHSLDTDWAHVQSFPGYFKRVHFNFSGYIVAASRFAAITGTPSDFASLLRDLRFFSRLCTLALLLLVFSTASQLWGRGYALLAVCATLTAPLLYQDAHYARPEAFGTLLFTCVFALSLHGNDDVRGDPLRLMLIAVISGFLVSIKVTYVAAVVMGLPVLWRCAMHRRTGPARPMKRLLILVPPAALLFVTGFAAGAPHALSDPRAFLDGLGALAHQYRSGNPPDSLPDYSFASQITWIGGYFAATLGWPALLLQSFGYCNPDGNTRARASMLAYLAITATTVLLFARQHVFFERNFSHLLPVFLIISTGGLKWLASRLSMATPAAAAPVVRVAFVAIMFAWWQSTPVRVSRLLHRTFSLHGVQSGSRKYQALVAETARSTGASRIEPVGFPLVYRNTLPHAPVGVCTLYDVTTYDDPWSRRFIAGLPPGFRVAREVPSLFHGIPTSTLQTYQSPTRYLIYDSKNCHG